MPNKLNPIRKRIIKRELKKGKTAKDSLLAAGYKESTAKRSTMNKSIKICQKEIKKEFDASMITVEYVLKELQKAKEMCLKAKDRTNYLRAIEAFGRHLAMFTDKKEVKDTSTHPLWQEFRGRGIPDIVVDN